MDNEQTSIKQRKEKIMNLFKNKTNLILIGIIILAVILRLYYFYATQGQTLWWDEAEYMATAKHWAFDVPYDVNPQRPPLFQFMSALAFMVGFGENFIRLILVILPSILLVFVTYLFGKELFNEKVGLIAAFLMCVSWTILFWTARVQPDFLSMVFQVAAMTAMWRFWKTGKSKPVIWAGIFAALGFYFKVSALLVPMTFMVFIALKDRLSAFKNKKYYYFALAFLLTLIPYFLWANSNFGTPLAFRQGYSAGVESSQPFGWYNLEFYYFMTTGIRDFAPLVIENISFLLFIVGLVIGLKFLLYLDILAKDRNKCFDPALFSIIGMAVVSAFYIFYIRGTDDRWVFLWLPFIFCIIGNALLFVYSKIQKYNKEAAVIVISILIFGLGYMQFHHADALIKGKENSYLPVKEIGLWIKDNTPPETKVLSISYTQMVYYTERNVSTYSQIKDGTAFEAYIAANRPDLLTVSLFEPHPEWIYSWIEANGAHLKPVQAIFSDAEKKQPVIVVYQFIDFPSV